jgi:hypothetical protein
MVAEVVEAGGNTAGTGAREVGGIRVGAEDHVRSAEDFDAIGMRGGVSKEAVESGHGVGGGMSLLRGQSAGGGQETRVHSAAIVQEVAYGYLEFLCLRGGGWRGGVKGGRRLGFAGAEDGGV